MSLPHHKNYKKVTDKYFNHLLTKKETGKLKGDKAMRLVDKLSQWYALNQLNMATPTPKG